MTVSSQRTLFGVDLALAQLFGANYECLPNTTLNEKFNIMPSTTVPAGKYPTLRYATIGCGGVPSITAANNYVYSNHSPFDGALFKHIPFVMRKLDSDLTQTERMKYRFRKEEQYNGEIYACYYLRDLGQSLYDQKFFKITNVNGNNYLKEHKLNDPKILHPVPRDRSVSFDTIEQTEFVTKLTRFKLAWDADELDELKKVYDILAINPRMLSEIALCSGIDVPTGNLSEATCVQIIFHFDINLDLTNTFKNLDSLVKYIEIGGTEALIY